MNFYDDLLVQLLAALGAALFVGNGWALVRRRADARAARTRGGRGGAKKKSPHRGRDDLTQAPIGRTVLYMVIGFVVMIAAIGSLVA